jgi:hypothetical protein
VTAIEIWTHRAPCANLESANAGAQRYNLDAKFMPQYAWIAKEWLVSAVGMVVSSADTNLLDANNRLGWTRRRRIGHRSQMKIAWIIEDNSAHLELPLTVRST